MSVLNGLRSVKFSVQGCDAVTELVRVVRVLLGFSRIRLMVRYEVTFHSSSYQ